MSSSVVLDTTLANCWQVTGGNNFKWQSPSARALLYSWKSGSWLTGTDNGRFPSLCFCRREVFYLWYHKIIALFQDKRAGVITACFPKIIFSILFPENKSQKGGSRLHCYGFDHPLYEVNVPLTIYCNDGGSGRNHQPFFANHTTFKSVLRNMLLLLLSTPLNWKVFCQNKRRII